MTRKHTASALALAIGLSLGAAAICQEKEGDLLKNGGFERLDPDGYPIGWLYGTPTGEKAEFTIVTDDPQEGQKSLRIKGWGKWAAAVSTPRISIDRSRVYILSGWIRVKQGRGLIKFDYFKGEQHVGQTWSRVVDSGGDWTELVVQSQCASFPSATHIVATVAGLAMHECEFDGLSMRAH